MQIISASGNPTIALTPIECVQLELKLNVSSKGKVWSHIGDILFEYGTAKKDALTAIRVSDEQYRFIQLLMVKDTWMSCRYV